MRCVVFELAGGAHMCPPPPGRAKVAQTPGRARVKMTVRELVIPFQRNKRPKSVTTAGRPAAHTDFSPIL